ncbi:MULTISPECIES: hypothetical protein [Halolamina]|uniref:Uncharacterized protein n=1 Tax=Halolamina pelagica TaxID=699431 RepID=A0A1I5VNR9_9EURY|nr:MULTISPECIES: hypothetical protein [Halolamina]NHX37844.1 hypothetical protein [Halolamina sp. R1-12]SFQ09083.1 hypothetical protein SAMN05216277_1198 [Halolamina pelagica]
MTDFVAIAAGGYGGRLHELEDDGTLKCNLDKKDNYEFERVPRESLDDDRKCCKHCSGEAMKAGGQGSTLAAKLAAADPDEVSLR